MHSEIDLYNDESFSYALRSGVVADRVKSRIDLGYMK